MSTMTSAYGEAMKKSYANQGKDLVLAPRGTRKIREILMGSQPLGISNYPSEKGETVLMAFYFEPSICILDVYHNGHGDIQCTVSHIRGAKYKGRNIRIFSNIAQPSGADRMQTVNAFDGKIWVTRNSERDFFILAPSKDSEEAWILEMKLRLPNVEGVPMMVHSALLHDWQLFTIESPENLEGWVARRYEMANKQGRTRFTVAESSPTGNFRYGIAFRNDDPVAWTVTDFRSKEPHGIYHGDNLVVPGIDGNGICFLLNGSALVTRYGQSHPEPFNGLPGALFYIPPSFLKT